ncbi:MAG TPA: efflux RND transporter periplasmic adaptor subunit [Gemmatimonadales bacterium]
MRCVVLALAAVLSACGEEAPAPPPPTEVVVAPVASRDVPVIAEFTGQIRGAEDVQVMARVSGFLQEQAFRQGELVRKGDLLFLIDPAPLQAARAKARADVAEAEARLARATVQVNRLRPLAAQNAVSQQDLDNAEASMAAAQAALEGARAVLDKAELDLGYTRVTSPIDGVAGLREVDLGTYVGSPQPTVLTVVSRIDPVRFDFGIAESEYLALARESSAAGRGSRRTEENLELVLADGSIHPQKGRVSVIGRGVDPATGTLPIQAVFTNPEKVLRPGQFARVRVPLRMLKNAVVVPQRAVIEVQGTFSVAVVGVDSTVEIRPITATTRVGSEWVVSSGLAPGERIVVEGIHKVRQGSKIRPVTATQAASDSAGAP